MDTFILFCIQFALSLQIESKDRLNLAHLACRTKNYGFMDALLKETVDAAINSRYPGMAPEGRRLIEEILIRKEIEKGALLLNEGQISHNIVFVGKGMKDASLSA